VRCGRVPSRRRRASNPDARKLMTETEVKVVPLHISAWEESGFAGSETSKHKIGRKTPNKFKGDRSDGR